MAQYITLAKNHLTRNDIKFTEPKENVLRVSFNGDNMKTVPIYIFFDKDNDPYIKLSCWEIANFKDKLANGYIICNKLNDDYRWVKFYLDSDGDIRCSIDACVTEESCGTILLQLIIRMVSILDDTYKEFMKALWS